MISAQEAKELSEHNLLALEIQEASKLEEECVKLRELVDTEIKNTVLKGEFRIVFNVNKYKYKFSPLCFKKLIAELENLGFKVDDEINLIISWK